MSLDPTTGATASQDAVDLQIQRGIDGDLLLSNADIASEIAQAYFDYSKQGTLPGADLTVGGTKSLLDAAFLSETSPLILATGICNYWATNNTPGTPAHGGTVVVSVVINSAASISAMESAITAFMSSPSPPGFLGFYQATEAVVKTFACIVTETLPGPPPVNTPFPETIT